MAEISQRRLRNSKRTNGEARRGERVREGGRLGAEAAGVIMAVGCRPASRLFHQVVPRRTLLTPDAAQLIIAFRDVSRMSGFLGIFCADLPVSR